MAAARGLERGRAALPGAAQAADRRADEPRLRERLRGAGAAGGAGERGGRQHRADRGQGRLARLHRPDLRARERDADAAAGARRGAARPALRPVARGAAAAARPPGAVRADRARAAHRDPAARLARAGAIRTCSSRPRSWSTTPRRRAFRRDGDWLVAEIPRKGLAEGADAVTRHPQARRCRQRGDLRRRSRARCRPAASWSPAGGAGNLGAAVGCCSAGRCSAG